jgi:hypothetical protein
MTIRPVQLLVLGFSGPRAHGVIAGELKRLQDSDMVRVVDALVVVKDANGETVALEASQLTGAESASTGRWWGGRRARRGRRAGMEAGAEAVPVVPGQVPMVPGRVPVVLGQAGAAWGRARRWQAAAGNRPATPPKGPGVNERYRKEDAEGAAAMQVERVSLVTTIWVMPEATAEVAGTGGVGGGSRTRGAGAGSGQRGPARLEMERR